MTKLEQLVEIQEEIIEIFRKHRTPNREAEALLLFLAGISAGACQRPILNNEWGTPAMIGWQAGANHEPIQ